MRHVENWLLIIFFVLACVGVFQLSIYAGIIYLCLLFILGWNGEEEDTKDDQ